MPLKSQLSFRCVAAFAGAALLAFGIYNVHAVSDITEGGITGLTLLLNHWFSISPAYSNFILSALCYLFGGHLFGREFIVCSASGICGYSLSYWICEQFEPLWPALHTMPMTAALLGAVFVGVGAGLCVRVGGAAGGDDALAMVIAGVTPFRIEQVYLILDVLVLTFSLSYIPLRRLFYSFLSVILSGRIVGWIQRFPAKKKE